MEEAKKTGRGGARLGAGRKKIGTDIRISIASRVDPHTKEILLSKAEKLGISFGVLLDRIAGKIEEGTML